MIQRAWLPDNCIYLVSRFMVFKPTFINSPHALLRRSHHHRRLHGSPGHVGAKRTVLSQVCIRHARAQKKQKHTGRTPANHHEHRWWLDLTMKFWRECGVKQKKRNVGLKKHLFGGVHLNTSNKKETLQDAQRKIAMDRRRVFESSPRSGPFWQRPSCSKWSDSRGPRRDLGWVQHQKHGPPENSRPW